jgi:hypothetical protein
LNNSIINSPKKRRIWKILLFKWKLY